MLCKKCKGKVFVDRQYSSVMHLETFCITCGNRKFYHPPTESAEGRWLLEKELYRTKSTITSL
jgi:predicted  nucleic acid-binding Zn-ribbon protein